MPDDPRVQRLLDELASSDASPEEVCGSCPELLPQVRERWRQMCRAQAALDAVFPPADSTNKGSSTDGPENVALPVIPGYEVEAVLGRGGMGVVFRARHLRLNRVVALKMTLAGSYAGAHERSRFQQEAEAVARLQHPNVVQLHDVGDSDGRPYFTMEYIAGGSLAQKLAGDPQPARETAALVAALASAVQVAHNSEIVHRDLKPANVLLTADGTPKISDFGLARRLDGGPGLTWTGTALGTPSYMAPEQARGELNAVGPSVDIYSLGAILYEMLTGRPPFRAESAAATVEQVLTRDPVSPFRLNPTVPRDLETICLKCLQKAPAHRYVSAQALADDLRRFEEGRPIEARPTRRVENLVRWVRRRPAAAGLVVAVVLLVSAGAAGAWALYQQRLTAHARQAQTDQTVRGVIQQADVKRTAGWLAHDLAKLTEARSEANQAEGIARSGGASPEVQQAAQAFREDAALRLERAKKNRALMEAVLDVSGPRERDSALRDKAGRLLAQPTMDEEYAAAFRQWGLDVEGTAEAEVVERLRQEPDVVVQELIAGLDGWMSERRQLNRPGAQWRRLFRVAEQLDHSDRRRRLRALLVGESSPRAEWVAGLVGVGAPWPTLWEQARGNTWRHLLEVRREIDPAHEPALTVVLLAQACAAVGDTAAAEEVLGQAVTTQPGQVVLLHALAKMLEHQGSSRLEEAIGYYRAARALRPNLGVVLSIALCHTGRAKQGEEVVRDLIRQQPNNYAYRPRLGFTLVEQGKYAEAVATMRKAIALKPDYADAYNDLGNTLLLQEKHAEAEAAYHKAIDLKPDYAGCYNNLAVALNLQNRCAEAEAAARKAIDLKPNDAGPYNVLGLALTGQRKYAGAEAALRKSVVLQPGFAKVYVNLGVALNAQQKYGEAEPVLTKAIELQPMDAEAYTDLGSSLAGQQKHIQAEAALHKAIALQADSGEPLFVLGFELMQQARFDEAAGALKKAEILFPKKDPGRKQARQLLQQCQRYLSLDVRLPAILHGRDKAANAAEQLEFGDLCIRKRLFAAAAHFCAGAFSADPKLAQDVPASTRYNAACAAVMAGCAQGKDADKLDDKERAQLRRQALDWLRQDLSWWAKKIENSTGLENTPIGPRNWQSDPDLAGIRTRDSLARLPDEERVQWERLWSDVDALLRQASRSE